ncbi:MAG: Fic family protein [archaeon]|nr:Fic family protein [archaeon]MCR4323403.1 Fic family protein [Nanoarchaeota archaeon]
MTYFKNIKRTTEEIINHNKHILSVSGGNFGIINKSTLEFAVDSVNNEIDPIKQAGNFLYYAGAGHPFENGNKRTAFEIAKGIMASGAIVIDASETGIINFVTGSVAQGKTDVKTVTNWLSSHSRLTDEHPEFNRITKENIDKDKELLKKLD